jgi:hypothetical protein
MAQPVTVTGASVKIKLSGVLYPQAQSISYTIDYGEEPIYGIDSPYPQEIRQTRISVQGQIVGMRIRASGGIQTAKVRTEISRSLQAPYMSVQIIDISTEEIILFIAQAKVTSQSITVAAKGVLQLSFSFKGIIPLEDNDVT